MHKGTVGLLVCLLACSDAALASNPVVRVIVKNESADAARLALDGKNDMYTLSRASPRPDQEISAGAMDVFEVMPVQGPLANVVDLGYRWGREHCRFRSAYTAAIAGRKAIWNKSAEGATSAGACTAEISDIDPNTHSWTVQFVIRGGNAP